MPPRSNMPYVYVRRWCGHCRQMVPEFKRVAAMLKGRGIKVAAVNSDNEPGLAQSLGIRGFPAIKWAYAGQLADYAGPRTAVEMVAFANQQAMISQVKAKLGDAVSGAKQVVGKMSKLAMSKVLGRQQESAPPQQQQQQQTGAGAAAA